MLLMGNSKRIFLLFYIFFIFYYTTFAGIQNVDIALQITYPGASQKMIGDKLVVDLGYLNENQSYTGNNKIEIGTVKVKITQKKTVEESGCILEEIDLDTVKLESLKNYSEKISVVDKIYMGDGQKIMLTATDVNNVQPFGDIDLATDSNKTLYFVAPDCLQEKDNGFEGSALTSLSYEFKLYADIDNTMGRGTIVGAMAKNQDGVELSIRELILRQVRNTNNTNSFKIKRRK